MYERVVIDSEYVWIAAENERVLVYSRPLVGFGGLWEALGG